MIISRTPLRVTFAGGGSDLSAFYRTEPGAVVTTAINKYIYINVNEKFDNKIRASYSVTEIVNSADELKNELIRESLKLTEQRGALEVTSISDIPSEGTGLGSSSTYTVGLLNALHAFHGEHAGATRLAAEACHVEIDVCGKPIGKQDQYIAAFGGLQYIQFNSDESVFVDPIICSPATKRGLQDHLLLLYTGMTRSSGAVLEEQKRNTGETGPRREALRSMTSLARELRDALYRDDLSTFGEILHQGWLSKRSLASGISNQRIDEWYECARKHGALGGKILGAGGGGFLLLFAPPERHQEIRTALCALKPVAFQFEPQGSKIVYVEEANRYV